MPDNTQTTIKMAHIIDYWTETATRRNENVTTGMDLYYLSHQSMQELHKNGHFVIAGMNWGRFTALTTMLNREQKAPDSTIAAYNNQTGGILRYCYSINSCIGKKLVLVLPFTFCPTNNWIPRAQFLMRMNSPSMTVITTITVCIWKLGHSEVAVVLI